MKNEQSCQEDFPFVTLENPELQNTFFCLNSHQALEYCINQKCQASHAFICGVKRCQCRKSHHECLKADLEFTLEKIHSKIINPQALKDNIANKFDTLIDKISEFRDRITSKLSSTSPDLNLTRLSKLEKQFLEITNKNALHKFVPSQTSQIWHNLQKPYSSKFDLFTEITQEVDKFYKIVQANEKSTQEKIKKILQKHEIINSSQNEKLSIDAAFKVDSSILTGEEMINRLKELFKRPIEDVKLLYKASEHDFSMPKYYELCGDATDTMFVCQTKLNRIIGGFTPIKFGSEKGETIRGFVGDNSGRSFMFSLTENERFELEKKHQAIYRDPNKMELTFGNVDLELCDKADKVNKSSTFLRNKAYSNGKYQDNPESFKRLTGSEDIHFMTKEWEVWKMTFEDDKENIKEESEEEKDFNLVGLFGP